MPMFDFKCNHCELVVEKYVKKPEDPIFCEKCCKPMVKLFSSFRFQYGVGEFFEPYVDTDIHPEGKPLKIETKEDFFTQCRKYGRGWRKVSDRMR